MRLPIIFFFLVIFQNLIFAQSTKDLDAKNGFRHLKFGSAPSQISNIVKQKNQFSKNPLVATYDYIGNDIEYVANVKVKSIDLTFFENKLTSIGVRFGDIVTNKEFSYLDYNTIFIWLKNSFGDDYKLPKNNDGAILNGAIWVGTNVKLELLRIDFSKSKSNPNERSFINGTIHIIDKKLNQKIYDSEF
jgi:hypothetical protein